MKCLTWGPSWFNIHTHVGYPDNPNCINNTEVDGPQIRLRWLKIGKTIMYDWAI